MPSCVIDVRVIRPGDRAEELIAEVAQRLGIQPDRKLSSEVASFWFIDATWDRAVNRVEHALGRSGSDWTTYLLLRYPSGY